jgi:hypothetical protein
VIFKLRKYLVWCITYADVEVGKFGVMCSADRVFIIILVGNLLNVDILTFLVPVLLVLRPSWDPLLPLLRALPSPIFAP